MNDLHFQTGTMDQVRILVVDDEAAFLEITKLLLERQGYLVTPATGCNEAFTHLKNNPDSFDVILTDYGMPIINGIELALMIRKLSVNVPIIISTGNDFQINERQIARAGISGIVCKPYRSYDLDKAIRKAMNEYKEKQQ